MNYENNKLAKFFYDDCLEKEYFFPSSSTAFETDFLRSFYSEMCLCPEYSFYQKSMTYNLNVPTGNDVLVPKRFVEAFFQFALLDMWKLFNTQVGLSTLIQSHDVDRNISDLTSTLKHQFQQYYSTHRCNTPGCGTVIGFDADCKVNMSVIYSKVMCHVMWLFSIGGKFDTWPTWGLPEDLPETFLRKPCRRRRQRRRRRRWRWGWEKEVKPTPTPTPTPMATGKGKKR